MKRLRSIILKSVLATLLVSACAAPVPAGEVYPGNPIIVDDPLSPGSFQIGRAEYSQDDFFPTLGGASNVDLRAVVRYPATDAGDGTPVADGVHPLFIIEHGNHSFCETSVMGYPYGHAACPVDKRTPNHKGYMNLLDVLASNGIIAVSIDAYDLTGPVPGWIPERGILILKHLELWSHMNDTNSYPDYPDFFNGSFAGHVDMTKIQVSGHSRGGEAAVAAYMLNTDFNIGSVSSIAPVDFWSYALPDVPYFVILPAADGDVTDLGGMRIYDRAGSDSDQITKSAIYIYGANHNFFNTVWADDRDDSSQSRDDYIAKADQQRLGEAYLAAFARVHLKGETVYEQMLRGRANFASTQGFKIFHIRHEKSHTKAEAGTGISATASNLSMATTTPPSHATSALLITWTSSGGELTLSAPSGSWDATSYQTLSLRAAQTNSSVNPADSPQNFQVELESDGVTKSVNISSLGGGVPWPYDHPFPQVIDHNIMTTFRISLQSFTATTGGLDLTDIDAIRLRFSQPGQGEVYVDDVEFTVSE